MDLEEALEQFDATEANLRRLSDAWEEMRSLVPSGISFTGAGAEDKRYRELLFSYEQLRKALPAISGFRITATPMQLDEIAQARLDVSEIGEVSAEVSLEDEIEAPGREIDQYQLLFRQARRQLVRQRVDDLSSEVTSLLRGIVGRVPNEPVQMEDEALPPLRAAFDELERLAGPLVPRDQHWNDMRRHLHFAQGHDLHDIARRDWPKVQASLRTSLDEGPEPLSVEATDLAELVRAAPPGRATISLDWAALEDDRFERLIFNLVADASTYENPQWLTNTNAPDRGRDISADRLISDELAGTVRQRVIFQVKHRLASPVRVADVSELVAQMTLWEPPPVDILVIATSGRFVTDAIQWVEAHNAKGDHPRIEMWPDSHLELLLSRRPDLAAEAGLHRSANAAPPEATT